MEPLIEEMIALASRVRGAENGPVAPAQPANLRVGVAPRGRLTADLLRRMGSELTPNAPKPEISMEPVSMEIEGRPSVQELYNKLDIANRKPLDYSKLEAINRARADAGGRDFLGGLALQAFGGQTLAPAGNHVLTQALKDREPIRPNAADIGWSDPNTGNVVESPMMARQQEEKLITGRIDALIKEQEAEARMALAKGQMELAAQARRNADILAAQRNGLQTVVINNRTDEAAAKAAGKGGEKPVQGMLSPNGKPVYIRDGNYVEADGSVVINPMGKEAFTKQTENLKAGDDAYTQAKSILANAKQNPGAFGFFPAVTASLPPQLGIKSTAERLAMTPSERAVRADIAQRSSEIIKRLSGAAVSAAEFQRLDDFLPKQTDDIEAIKIKLKSAVDVYDRWKNHAQTRGPVTANPVSLPNVDEAAAIDAEIAKRSKPKRRKDD